MRKIRRQGVRLEKLLRRDCVKLDGENQFVDDAGSKLRFASAEGKHERLVNSLRSAWRACVRFSTVVRDNNLLPVPKRRQSSQSMHRKPREI